MVNRRTAGSDIEIVVFFQNRYFGSGNERDWAPPGGAKRENDQPRGVQKGGLRPSVGGYGRIQSLQPHPFLPHGGTGSFG